MTVRNSRSLLFAAVMLVSVAQESRLEAQPGVYPHWNCRRVANQNGLRAYDYRHDLQRFRASALAIADPVVIEEWREEYVVDAGYQYGAQRSEVPTFGSLMPDGKKEALVRTVSRKPFHFTTASLVANDVTLQQVGLSIYETGTIAATGRISHDGGPDGSLAGANVTLIVRAYASPTPGNFANQLPLNSPVIWQSNQRLWVSRNQPRVIPLVGSSNSYAREFRQNFHQITHLEVELEAERDR